MLALVQNDGWVVSHYYSIDIVSVSQVLDLFLGVPSSVEFLILPRAIAYFIVDR